jgi:hypothetical protein
VLVVVALRRTTMPRWMAAVGLTAAGLIATGVVIPLVEQASLTNFAGYVIWCVWLLGVAVLLVRAPRTGGVGHHRHPQAEARDAEAHSAA